MRISPILFGKCCFLEATCHLWLLKSLGLEGRVVVNIYHVEMSAPRSRSARCPAVGLSVDCYTARRSFSDGVTDAFIHVYSDSLLRVILMLCSCSRKCSRLSCRAHSLFNLRFSALLTVSYMSSISWALNPILKVVGYSYNIYVTIVPVGLSSWKVVIVTYRVPTWVRLITFLSQ